MASRNADIADSNLPGDRAHGSILPTDRGPRINNRGIGAPGSIYRGIGAPGSILDRGDLGVADEPELFSHLLFDLLERLRIFAQEALGVFAPLSEPLAAIREPGTALFDDAFVDGEVEQISLARDAFAVHDIEFGFTERRGDLVLDDLHARATTDDRVAILDAGNAANIDAHRRVELECAATGRRFRITEHNANLFAELIDEDQTGLRLRDRAGQFAQSLRHEARLKAHLRIAHFTLDFGARHE